MTNSVVGQFFEVVTCQVCGSDVTFQQASSARPAEDGEPALEIKCRLCGHAGVYRAGQIRQAQAQYPL